MLMQIEGRAVQVCTTVLRFAFARGYSVSVNPALYDGRFVMVSSESLNWETRFDTRTVSVKRKEGAHLRC